MSFENFILCGIVSTLTEVLRNVYLMTRVFEDRNRLRLPLKCNEAKAMRERTSSDTKFIDQKYCPSSGTAFIKDR